MSPLVFLLSQYARISVLLGFFLSVCLNLSSYPVYVSLPSKDLINGCWLNHFPFGFQPLGYLTSLLLFLLPREVSIIHKKINNSEGCTSVSSPCWAGSSAQPRCCSPTPISGLKLFFIPGTEEKRRKSPASFARVSYSCNSNNIQFRHSYSTSLHFHPIFHWVPTSFSSPQKGLVTSSICCSHCPLKTAQEAETQHSCHGELFRISSLCPKCSF